jgi:hypothetical protein
LFFDAASRKPALSAIEVDLRFTRQAKGWNALFPSQRAGAFVSNERMEEKRKKTTKSNISICPTLAANCAAKAGHSQPGHYSPSILKKSISGRWQGDHEAGEERLVQ